MYGTQADTERAQGEGRSVASRFIIVALIIYLCFIQIKLFS